VGAVSARTPYTPTRRPHLSGWRVRRRARAVAPEAWSTGCSGNPGRFAHHRRGTDELLGLMAWLRNDDLNAVTRPAHPIAAETWDAVSAGAPRRAPGHRPFQAVPPHVESVEHGPYAARLRAAEDPALRMAVRPGRSPRVLGTAHGLRHVPGAAPGPADRTRTGPVLPRLRSGRPRTYTPEQDGSQHKTALDGPSWAGSTRVWRGQ
jgi:hypothetical protein